RHLNTGAVQDTHDYRLSVVGRQDADAQIEVLARDGHLDTAVLGASLFRDVDRPHDLDTRHHRGQEAPRRRVALDQDTVDAVAHPDAVGERLDVDVAGPQADGLGDDQVDQLDHRGVGVLGGGQVLGLLRLREVDLRVG